MGCKIYLGYVGILGRPAQVMCVRHLLSWLELILCVLVVTKWYTVV